MQAAEARALGALAGGAIAGTAARVADVHAAVLARTPARRTGVALAHDAIARSVYATVRAVSAAAAGAVGAGVGLARAPAAPALADSRAGALALGALSGIYGDLVERDHAALAPTMGVRVAGRPVPPEPAALAAAFPAAGSRIAVFVHGLCETEAAWRLFAPPGGPATYGDRLRADFGHTPVYVRHNSGLPVGENARRLADLLDAVVAGWPVEVDEVLLMGHSLGGLVAMHACHDADRRGLAWVRSLRHVVCLASPHHGAPLAKGVHAASEALSRVPETRAFARILELRSAGVRDLRHGSVEDIPFVPGATYYAVSATVTRDPAHPLGRVLGDLLVRRESASGHGPRGRRVPFELDNAHHAGGLTHFHVLNDPDVYARLRLWLERGVPA
jgi:hypothetical protein